MAKRKFEYMTYIAAPPRKVWKALLDPEFTHQYWGVENVSDWKPGSPWEHRNCGGRREVVIAGKVLECSLPKRVVITWASPNDLGRPERVSRVTIDLASYRKITRLTLTHDRLQAGSRMLEGISDGWPKALSSLKSLLETGRPLPGLW